MVNFSKEPISSSSTSSFTSRRFSSQFQCPRSPSLRFTLKASGSAHFPGDDDFGFYPWENPDAAESSVQWVSEEKVTLFTSDGLIQIGGNLVPRRVTSADRLFFVMGLSEHLGNAVTVFLTEASVLIRNGDGSTQDAVDKQVSLIQNSMEKLKKKIAYLRGGEALVQGVASHGSEPSR